MHTLKSLWWYAFIKHREKCLWAIYWHSYSFLGSPMPRKKAWPLNPWKLRALLLSSLSFLYFIFLYLWGSLFHWFSWWLPARSTWIEGPWLIERQSGRIISWLLNSENTCMSDVPLILNRPRSSFCTIIQMCMDSAVFISKEWICLEDWLALLLGIALMGSWISFKTERIILSKEIVGYQQEANMSRTPSSSDVKIKQLELISFLFLKTSMDWRHSEAFLSRETRVIVECQWKGFRLEWLLIFQQPGSRRDQWMDNRNHQWTLS